MCQTHDGLQLEVLLAFQQMKVTVYRTADAVTTLLAPRKTSLSTSQFWKDTILSEWPTTLRSSLYDEVIFPITWGMRERTEWRCSSFMIFSMCPTAVRIVWFLSCKCESQTCLSTSTAMEVYYWEERVIRALGSKYWRSMVYPFSEPCWKAMILMRESRNTGP